MWEKPETRIVPVPEPPNSCELAGALMVRDDRRNVSVWAIVLREPEERTTVRIMYRQGSFGTFYLCSDPAMMAVVL